jgi:hypothetical protein
MPDDPAIAFQMDLPIGKLRSTKYVHPKPLSLNNQLLEGYQQPDDAVEVQQVLDAEQKGKKRGPTSEVFIVDSEDESDLEGLVSKSRKTSTTSTPVRSRARHMLIPSSQTPTRPARGQADTIGPSTPLPVIQVPASMPWGQSGIVRLHLDPLGNPITGGVGLEAANRYVKEIVQKVKATERVRVISAINKQRAVWYSAKHQGAELPREQKFSLAKAKPKPKARAK